MYLIKDLPSQERPRERLETFGAKALSTYELLAIILRVGNKGQSVIDLAKRLVQELNQLSDLRTITLDELQSVKGIGKTKAITVLAAIELGERVLKQELDKIPIYSPNDVYELLKYDLQGLKQEVLMALYLDLKSNLITKKVIFKGSLNQSLIHPREIFKYAVKFSAYNLILVHNHPSGDPTPSNQDIEVTEIIKKAGDILQIKVIDHVIIGGNSYTSIINYKANQKKHLH
ncbi:MAG: DNA repair protein RadC [Candidatus Izemoplasmatales bacterium]